LADKAICGSLAIVRLGEFGRSSATVTLTMLELSVLNNALNEVCNGVRDLEHDGEFATRLGMSRNDARKLLADLNALIERAEPLPG
jgi:hypothetical protein